MSAPPVFVSATSRDLGTARRAVFDALTTLGIPAVEQTHFPPDYQTIRDMLRAKIAGCGSVVHVAGRMYGGEPAPATGEPRRSYTQLEVDIADELGKPVFVFLAVDGFPFDDHPPEPDDLRQLQRDHHARLRGRPQKWEEVSSVHHLLYRVAVTPFPGLRRFADPHKPRNLPFDSLGDLFKGRDEFLLALWRSLEREPGRAAAVVAKQAIHGLGGVGKTRLAIEYAHRFADRYSALLFVSADGESALRAGLAGLCGPAVLNLPELEVRYTPGSPNLSEWQRRVEEEEVRAAAAVRWLVANPGWLLILDNVDAPEAARAVRELLPRVPGGHAVITSRLDRWWAGVQPLPLDVLGTGPAASYLLDRTRDGRRPTPTDPVDAAGLAADLGGLAVALEQAAGYVVANAESLAGYRAVLAGSAGLLDWHDDLLMEYPRPLAATWQTTVERLSAGGRGLLNVLAWLAPDPIPVDLVLASPAGDRAGGTRFDPGNGLEELTRYSLVKRSADKSAVTVHRLVQAVTRFRTPESDRRGWIEQAVRMMNRFVAGRTPGGGDRPPDAAVSAHGPSVLGHAGEAGIAADPAGRLLNEAGVFLLACGLRTSARAAPTHEPMFRYALAAAERGYGPDHPEAAVALNNLAWLLRSAGRPAAAEPLYRRALAIDERASGPHGPEAAVDLNNLAELLRDTGRAGEAGPLYARAVGILHHSRAADGHAHLNRAVALANYRLFLAERGLSEAEIVRRLADELGPDYDPAG